MLPETPNMFKKDINPNATQKEDVFEDLEDLYATQQEIDSTQARAAAFSSEYKIKKLNLEGIENNEEGDEPQLS